jgi:DNA-binding NtrC family response regulator
VIASSYRDLKQEVSAARFRDDLYSRLNGVALVLPPLGNRVEDIVPLSKRFIAKYGVGPGKKEVMELDPRAIAFLEQYPFPGNVRELQNMIERWMMLCVGKTVTAMELPAAH